MSKAKFSLGQVVITPGAKDALEHNDVVTALSRHCTGDFGDVCEEDKALNEEAVATGDRILSAYIDRNGIKFWIITEWDRSATTILLPSEYCNAPACRSESPLLPASLPGRHGLLPA